MRGRGAQATPRVTRPMPFNAAPSSFRLPMRGTQVSTSDEHAWTSGQPGQINWDHADFYGGSSTMAAAPTVLTPGECLVSTHFAPFSDLSWSSARIITRTDDAHLAIPRPASYRLRRLCPPRPAGAWTPPGLSASSASATSRHRVYAARPAGHRPSPSLDAVSSTEVPSLEQTAITWRDSSRFVKFPMK